MNTNDTKHEKDLTKVRQFLVQAYFLVRDVESRRRGYASYADLFCKCLEGTDKDIDKANTDLSFVNATTGLLRVVLETTPYR